MNVTLQKVTLTGVAMLYFSTVVPAVASVITILPLFFWASALLYSRTPSQILAALLALAVIPGAIAGVGFGVALFLRRRQEISRRWASVRGALSCAISFLACLTILSGNFSFDSPGDALLGVGFSLFLSSFAAVGGAICAPWLIEAAIRLGYWREVLGSYEASQVAK
jgi:hypothetical protein